MLPQPSSSNADPSADTSSQPPVKLPSMAEDVAMMPTRSHLKRSREVGDDGDQDDPPGIEKTKRGYVTMAQAMKAIGKDAKDPYFEGSKPKLNAKDSQNSILT